MPKSITLATAVDKNRVSSDNVYLLLLEVDIINAATGKVSETLYIANNNEDITFGGTSYQAIPFECELTQDKDSAPTATLTVYDFTQSIIAALTTEGWSLSWPARFKVINAKNLDSGKVDLEQNFKLMDATAGSDKFSVSFTIGAENPLSLRFPVRQQFRERCAWGYMGGYKGPRCKYTGTLDSCDYTFTGSNGCIVHKNTLNYGGFPGVEHSA